jgi:heavy metal translocating P-type ATPase
MPTFCDHCGLPVTDGGIPGEDAADAHYCCYGCRMLDETGADAADDDASSEQQVLLIRLFAGVLMAGFVMAFSLAISSGYGFGALQRLEHDVSTAHWVLLIPAVPALLLLGGPVLRTAWRDLHDRHLSLNVLFALGTSSAVGVSAVSYLRGTGPIYLETAVMLLALYTLGRYLTARTKGRTSRVWRRLLEVPDTTYQRLAPDAGEVSGDALRVGDRVRIRAGDVVPADGRVVEGRSYVDASSLTGEARPDVATPGAPVYAGTSVLDGALTVEVTAVQQDRRLAQVEQMMRRALQRPPRIARLTDRIMRWLIPGVVVLALGTFGAWWWMAGFAKALYVALSVVLITCPCALGIAIPLTLVQAMGHAARQGVLLRSGRSLLTLAEVEAVAFDKTGTLSSIAAPSVRVLRPDPAPVPAGSHGRASPTDDAIVRRAAAVEQGTRHALATAIVEEADARDLDVPAATDLRTVAGAGVIGTVTIDGLPRRVGVGNEALLREMEVAAAPEWKTRHKEVTETGATALYVAEDDRVVALIAVEERIQPHAADAVNALQDAGCAVQILTGDRSSAAQRLADALALDADATLSPGDKTDRLRRLREAHGPVAMVGDGINDAAALAEANVGVALSEGAAVSIEAADVTLYNPDLRLLPWLRTLATRTRRIIHQNLAWTFGYNAIGLGLAVCGLLHPIAAVVIMTISSLIVTANAYRAKRLAVPQG